MSQQSPTHQLSSPLSGALPQGMEQGQPPHPIVELAEYPFRVPLSWWIALIVGLLSLAFGIFLWRWYRNRNQVHYAPRPENPLLLLLRSLESQNPPSPFPESMHCDYFFTLSMAFRQILEQAYSFPATDLTLKELKQPLKQKVSFDGYSYDAMLQFFERCDLIKFAKAPTHENEALSFHGQALSWAKAIVAKKTQQTDSSESFNPMPSSSS